MTDDVRDIPPALRDQEWGKRERLRVGSPGVESIRLGKAGLVIYDQDGSVRTNDVAELAALIALANAAYVDEDPRKFTREQVGALREAVMELHTYASKEAPIVRVMDVLHDLADVIESYLPPAPRGDD